MNILRVLNSILLAGILSALILIVLRMPQMPPTVGDFDKVKYDQMKTVALYHREPCITVVGEDNSPIAVKISP